ncbi:Uncharacterized protein dnm_064920 [Desulfonema magnum]|uniref:Uncharacterized protein n=1 Tax=Desulfonema magnum TaxID=45655 RepID=A0A975GQW1_9BACT|nr:Uncharacterized protein dnm_064920 [Desulfonema magnum]
MEPLRIILSLLSDRVRTDTRNLYVMELFYEDIISSIPSQDRHPESLCDGTLRPFPEDKG